MTDNDKTGSRPRRPLTLRGGSEKSHVKQSFSHGRTKSVVVETKRRRQINKPGSRPPQPVPPAPPPPPAPAPAPSPVAEVQQTIPEPPAPAVDELPDTERRQKEEYMRALAAEKLKEQERKLSEAEDQQKREVERELRKQEKIAKDRENEEVQRRIRERKEESRRAREKPARPQKPQRTPATPPAAPVQAEGTGEARGTPRRSEKPDDETRRRQARGRGQDKPRRSGKLTIAQALSGDGGRERSLASIRRAQARERRRTMGPEHKEREKIVRDVQIPEAITVQELANRMAERSASVIKALMANGIMATQNQAIDADTAELIVEEFGHTPTRVSDADVEDAIETAVDAPESLVSRPPVVTVMGHVDHGKTSILDVIRSANVVSVEAGGITQHIGAYQVSDSDGSRITFLDTPGHAAFTSMRARGAQVTDIVVLVVAADDAVMPQTVEAIDHTKAANVPMIVAINKIDREAADPEKVRSELLRHGVVVESMSGDVLDVEVSAMTGEGLDRLLEAISLQAEILELKANPDRRAEGAVIEAKLDTNRGNVATVLVQKGTLRRKDIIVVGEQWGKVRALVNDRGEQVDSAGPSEPVEVLGLNGTPVAGDTLHVLSSESEARGIVNYRIQQAKDRRFAAGTVVSIDQLLARAREGTEVRELPLVIKADAQGSAEAISQAVEKIGNEEVHVRVLHSGVGAITESDVALAEGSDAHIVGFNVRANAQARNRATQRSVEIRYYSIIYDLIDDVRDRASGLLSAEVREQFIGYAAIKEVFRITGVGRVAGCIVNEGTARRSAGVRLLRDNVVIHEGRLKTLKRFKDEVREVQAGQECGMAFENYDDVREGDVIEIFESEEIERSLA